MIIVIVWTVLGVFLAVNNHLLLSSHLSGGYAENYTFATSLIINIFSAIFGALLGGGFLVFWLERKFRSAPFWKGIVAVCVAFIVIVAIITFLMAVGQTWYETGEFITGDSGGERFWELILTTQHLKNIIFWAAIVGLTQLTLQISDKFGQGLLWGVIIGKYHLPRKEERIFMFLDLKSSTTIAEQLGNEKYHEFLKSIFIDVTDPILQNRGEIYQYVGDEVVISWKMENGIMNNHCIRCFFDVREKLQSRKEKYVARFGVVPEFKAGIHFGKVIAGEIGIIKRDITYSGDVLNTTARIQSQCNVNNATLLASRDLMNLLKTENDLQAKALGSIELKGREEEVELIALELEEND